jgi:hypothetical protein
MDTQSSLICKNFRLLQRRRNCQCNAPGWSASTKGGRRVSVFVEDWPSSYGSPYLVVSEDSPSGGAQLVEDGSDLCAHPGRLPAAAHVAFVDGVRRVEASLYEVSEMGGLARGVAGAHACGAVMVVDGQPPSFARVAVTRHVIFGSGVRGELPAIPGGWSWQPSSISDSDPDAPMAELQRRMRQAEAQLAEELCADGWFTVVDGPLSYVRSRDLPVVGYVKTHHRMLLTPAMHAAVPRLLPVGHRTSLFAHADRYSAYLRLVDPDTHAGPWSGIVRLELPQSAGLADVVARANSVAGLLPRFAGIRHRDPRAPQNLQPVSALEKYLRHLLGQADLATRAVRDAVARLNSQPVVAAVAR